MYFAGMLTRLFTVVVSLRWLGDSGGFKSSIHDMIIRKIRYALGMCVIGDDVFKIRKK